MAQLCINRPKPKTYLKRDWRFYSKTKLISELATVDWSNNASDVQEAWNDFEHKLIKVVDMVAPIVELNDEYFINKPCPIIKNKLNLRGRLLKIQKNRPTLELKKCI